MTTYRVIGHHAVRGVEPGGTFRAELSEWEEQMLTEAGHIERTKTFRFRPGEFTEEPASAGRKE